MAVSIEEKVASKHKLRQAAQRHSDLYVRCLEDDVARLL